MGLFKKKTISTDLSTTQQLNRITKEDLFGAMFSSKDFNGFEDILESNRIINRELYINKGIEAELANNIIQMIQFYNEYDNEISLPIKQRRPIKIYIDTIGGDTIAALGIVDAINLSKTPVITINVSKAYSAGFLIFINGDKRYCYPNSSFLFHEGSVSDMSGDANKCQDFSDFYKELRKKIKKIILEKTEISEELYKEKEKDDWYFFAEDAIKYGMADKIVKGVM